MSAANTPKSRTNMAIVNTTRWSIADVEDHTQEALARISRRFGGQAGKHSFANCGRGMWTATRCNARFNLKPVGAGSFHW